MSKSQARLLAEKDTESEVEPIAHALLAAGVSRSVVIEALYGAARELLPGYADDRNVSIDNTDLRAALIAEKAFASSALSILSA